MLEQAAAELARRFGIFPGLEQAAVHQLVERFVARVGESEGAVEQAEVAVGGVHGILVADDDHYRVLLVLALAVTAVLVAVALLAGLALIRVIGLAGAAAGLPLLARAAAAAAVGLPLSLPLVRLWLGLRLLWLLRLPALLPLACRDAHQARHLPGLALAFAFLLVLLLVALPAAAVLILLERLAAQVAARRRGAEVVDRHRRRRRQLVELVECDLVLDEVGRQDDGKHDDERNDDRCKQGHLAPSAAAVLGAPGAGAPVRERGLVDHDAVQQEAADRDQQDHRGEQRAGPGDLCRRAREAQHLDVDVADEEQLRGGDGVAVLAGAEDQQGEQEGASAGAGHQPRRAVEAGAECDRGDYGQAGGGEQVRRAQPHACARGQTRQTAAAQDRRAASGGMAQRVGQQHLQRHQREPHQVAGAVVGYRDGGVHQRHRHRQGVHQQAGQEEEVHR